VPDRKEQCGTGALWDGREQCGTGGSSVGQRQCGTGGSSVGQERVVWDGREQSEMRGSSSRREGTVWDGREQCRKGESSQCRMGKYWTGEVRDGRSVKEEEKQSYAGHRRIGKGDGWDLSSPQAPRTLLWPPSPRTGLGYQQPNSPHPRGGSQSRPPAD
jgi:hypothetical protein